MRISEFPKIRTFLKKSGNERFCKNTLCLGCYHCRHIPIEIVHYRLIRTDGAESIHFEQKVGNRRTFAIVFEDRTLLIKEADKTDQTALSKHRCVPVGQPSVDLLILPCLDEEVEQWGYFVFCDDACLDSLVTGKCSYNQAIVPLWCCLKACWLHTRKKTK